MTQKISKPQGSRSEESNKDESKKLSPALLFSTIFVAVSFIVMLIPLALFNIAQVSAMLGKRVAFFMMAAVSAVFLLLSFVFSSISLLSVGLTVVFSVPFFMVAIFIREKGKHWLFAGVVLFLPLILSFGYVCFIPANNTPFGEAQLGQTYSKIDEEKAKLESSIVGRNPTPLEAQKLESFTQYRESVEQIVSIPAVKEFLGYTPWQRMAYLVFGAGASFLLIGILTSLANLVLVDFGFDQVERLRAIVKYMRKNPSSFTTQINEVLPVLPVAKSKQLDSPIKILQHSSLGSSYESDSTRSWFLRKLWKPIKSKDTILWHGFSFKFEGKSAWNLRNFSLPLPLALTAVACIGATTFWYGSLESIVASLENGQNAPLIASMCVLSFFLIAIVALQGMFTIYRRLSTFLFLVCVGLFFIVGSKISFGPYATLAVFGAVGLLDYVYDWRGRKSQVS